MVVETSVLVAIILREEGFEEYVFKIADADVRWTSAANYLEASIALLRGRGAASLLELDQVIREADIAIVPVTAAHARIAQAAFMTYGKGMENSAQLNFGDWFGYALAQQLGEPLLFKGNDFSQTDVLKA